MKRILLASGILCGAGLFAPFAYAELPRDVARRIDAAVADMVRGRTAEAHVKLQPLLEQGAPAQQQEVEARLKRFQIADPLGPLVAGWRLDAALAAGSQPVRTLKPMGPIEAGFVLTAAEDRIKTLLEPVDKELAVGFRVDAPIEALEEQLARCSTLLDQMDSVEKLSALQNEAAKLGRAANKAKTALKKDSAQNKSRSDQLAARVVEISLVLIPDQLQVLRDDGAAYAARAKAVSRLEDAFAVAKLNFNKYRGAKKGKGKSVGGKTVGEQQSALKEQEREFDRLAGALRVKIYHFEQGKQWWLRGRWGVGPYHDGLTKAVPGGRAALEAFLFYPLLMPDPTPKPLDPLKDARPLPVARRHLDVWKAAFPAGRAYARAESNFAVSKQLWKLTLLPPGQSSANFAKIVENEEDFNPFVGYLEYQMALFHWGRLLTLAKDAELEGIEKSLADDERFIVQSYLSRQYDNADPRSSLKLTPPRSDDPRVADVYERRGLSWCIAFAQIEVAAMRATYTGLEYEPRPSADPRGDFFDTNTGQPPTKGGNRRRPTDATPTALRVPRAVRPFDRVVPTPFTQRALAELLWDGMRQQYYRIRTEVAMDRNRVALPSEFLPPAVRLGVALEFVKAYRQRFAKTLTAAQNEELRVWQTEIEQRLGEVMGAWARSVGGVFDVIDNNNRGLPTPQKQP